LAKLTLVVFLAAYLSARSAEGTLGRFFRGVLPAALAIGVCAVLVGSEDFGTAVLLAGVGGLMLLVAGGRWRHLLLLAGPALAAFAGLLLAKPYRMQRLTSFMDIWADPRGEGYHPIQSLITIASGGWFGRGLGGGIQKYGYLPESRTDFIFAVWCEETGLVGAAVVLLLFGLLLYLGTRAAQAAPTTFGRLLAVGLTLMVVLQAVMNIAVVTVAAPTKGIALPLVSAGGSGVVFLGASVGLLAGVALRGRYGVRSSAAGFCLGGAAPAKARGSIRASINGGRRYRG
jgi:cell division protein FtsW